MHYQVKSFHRYAFQQQTENEKHSSRTSNEILKDSARNINAIKRHADDELIIVPEKCISVCRFASEHVFHLIYSFILIFFSIQLLNLYFKMTSAIFNYLLHKPFEVLKLIKSIHKLIHIRVLRALIYQNKYYVEMWLD